MLLPYIPIKLTKDNYLQYIQRSISQIATQNNTENAKLLVSILEQLFDGHFCPSYGCDFKDLADTLTELRTSLHTEDFYENAELLGETIQSLLEMLHSLYKVTGSLSNLLLFDDIDFNAVTSLHVSFYDLYYSVKNILLSEEDRELFLSTLPDTVSDIKMQLEKFYNSACCAEHIDPLFSLIQTYLSLDVGHIFGFNVQKAASIDDETAKVLDDFILKLQECLLSLPNTERKIRMQYFMSTIPFIMSEHTFESYLKQAFSSLSNTHQSYVSAVYLCNLLESQGWFENNDTHEQTYSADTDSNGEKHAHDCDCGNHEHSHDCHCSDHEHSHDCHCDNHEHSHDCHCDNHEHSHDCDCDSHEH